MSEPALGLLAGGGELPSYLLTALKARGRRVAVIGFRGETAEGLLAEADERLTIEAGEWKKGLEFFRRHGVREALMAGYVAHTHIYRKESMETADSVAMSFLRFLRDRRADSLLGTVAWVLRRNGIRLVSSMPYLKPLMLDKGVRTRRPPTEMEWKDIRFGHRIAKKIAGLDVGQTVVVKNLAVVAVESLEGTDAAIRRAGEVGGPGTVVVKVAKPRQDFRFDVPVIGKKTVESLRAAGAAVLAVEAGKTIAMEREDTIKLADQAGIALVAL